MKLENKLIYTRQISVCPRALGSRVLSSPCVGSHSGGIALGK